MRAGVGGMALWALVAFAALLPQPARSATEDLELPRGQLGHLLESLLEPSKPWFHQGLLGSLQICSGDARPPLWIARRGGRTVYLAAASSMPAAALEPSSEPVKQAMACADVAYFELPCSPGSAGPVAKYLGHCLKYPTHTPLNSVKARLAPDELEALRAAALKLADKAQWSCRPAADGLRAAAVALNETETRTSLLALYQGVLAALSPTGCDPSGLDHGKSHEEWLREEFGSDRPSFGLEDVKLQCKLYEDSTVEQDALLARLLAGDFSDSAWYQSKMDRHKILADAMRCGNLQQLASNGGALQALPWLRRRLLDDRNPKLAQGIERALEQHPGKSVVAVMGLAHFVDMNGTSSVVSLLRQAGFSIEQARSGADLGCSRAAPAPPAERPGRCLEPADRAQPASCTAFGEAFKQALGEDTMYGRAKSSPNCKACSESNVTCMCDVEWTNTSGFEELCTGMTVDGVRGQVLAMDLVRNPGSIVPGNARAEKTVRGLYQKCYATSCSIPLLEEMALRSWYSKDSHLAQGMVMLRTPGQTSGLREGTLPPGSFWTWPWWVWPLGVLGAALAIRCLIACFLCRGPRKRGRGVDLALPSAHGSEPPPASAAAAAWGVPQPMVPPALAPLAQQPGYPTLLQQWGPSTQGQQMPLLVVKPSAGGPLGAWPAAQPLPGSASFGGSFHTGSFYGYEQLPPQRSFVRAPAPPEQGPAPGYEPLPVRQSFALEQLGQGLGGNSLPPARPSFALAPAGPPRALSHSTAGAVYPELPAERVARAAPALLPAAAPAPAPVAAAAPAAAGAGAEAVLPAAAEAGAAAGQAAEAAPDGARRLVRVV